MKINVKKTKNYEAVTCVSNRGEDGYVCLIEGQKSGAS